MFKVKLNKFRKKLTISNTYLLAQLYFFKTEVTLNKIFEMDAFKKYQPFKLMSYLRILAIVFSLISVINGFSQIPSYLSPNLLVGYWPFNGTANDLSGYGNNAVLNGVTFVKDRGGNTNRACYIANNTDLISMVIFKNTYGILVVA